MRVFLKTLAWIVGIVSVVYGLNEYNKATAPKCVETAIVQEILELQYRDGVIRLSNGDIKTVNQATLKVGSDICTKWSR